MHIDLAALMWLYSLPSSLYDLPCSCGYLHFFNVSIMLHGMLK